MKEFKTPIMNVAEFDTHIATLLSDIGKNADGVDETAWTKMENKFNARAVEITDIIKNN